MTFRNRASLFDIYVIGEISESYNLRYWPNIL
jgi:hypothetical protein